MFKKLFFMMMPEGDATGGGGAAPAAAAPATPEAAPTVAIASQDKPDGGIIADVNNPAENPAEKPAEETKDTETKSEDGEKKDDDAPKELTADDIKFETPDGIQITDDAAKAFKDVMADPNMSPAEKAQQLVNMHADALKAAAQVPYDLWSKTQADWQTAIKADKELGGQNLDAVRSIIAKAVTDVGGKEAAKIFEAFSFTGAANNPEIVRVMYRLSMAHTEGSHVDGSAPGSGNDKTASLLSSMYPSASKAR